jgi:hypothetical protein
MNDEFKFPEDKKPPSKEDIEQLLRDKGILKDKMKISFDGVEAFTALGFIGGFLHSLDHVDDSLFLDAINATLEIEEESENYIVSKKPATLTGYLVYNRVGNAIGFICFNSQIEV